MQIGKEVRRVTARQEILAACWDLAAKHGLSGFTLRQVAAAVGVQAPSLYSYFSSKGEMYDAMFKEAGEAFASSMAAVPIHTSPRATLRGAARAYLSFCVMDPVRHQLLFQRTLPGFEPSADAYAPAQAAYAHLRRGFAQVGITRSAHLDLWTALLAGMATQQLANEPGGKRWIRLANEAADMFLDHVREARP